jgi:serine/threonine protein kinase
MCPPPAPSVSCPPPLFSRQLLLRSLCQGSLASHLSIQPVTSWLAHLICLPNWEHPHPAASHGCNVCLPACLHADESVDVWALGCLLYFLVCGQSPFERAAGEAGGSLMLAVVK